MAVQKQDDQHEHTFSSYVRIRDVVLKTCLGRWTIGRSGERGSGISVLPARYDDDDDDVTVYICIREIYNTTLRYLNVPGYELDWLTGIIVNYGLDLTNKFRSSFLIRIIRVNHPTCPTYIITIGLIQIFLNILYCFQFNIQKFWNICIGASGMNASNTDCCFQVSEGSKLDHYAAFLTDSGRCPWWNGYRRRNWTWRYKFKSWTRLIAFYITLIPLGKVWIQLFSL